MFSTNFSLTFWVLIAVVKALPAPQAAYFPIPASPPAPGPAPPVNPDVTRSVSHGPYSGKPTIIGAPSLSVLAPSIPARPPNPTATTYIADGKLHDPQPAPYQPAGGLGTNGEEPVYNVKSDFDFHSLVRGSRFQRRFANALQAIAQYTEWIELDLFNYGLAKFSVEDFEEAGLTAEDRYLIQFMAEQEIGHATMIGNIIGPKAPLKCNYNYPFTTVREFLDFCQKLTRWGESGVYGFLNHLNSREAGQLLLQAISTEARQQMIFRQFDGLFPMPVWFEVGIPQSWTWTLLAPYISDCPANQTRLAWQNFPALRVLNQPNPARINANRTTLGEFIDDTGAGTLNETAVPEQDRCRDAKVIDEDCGPRITQNRSIPLSFPGRKVFFDWENPGKAVGPNNSYVTDTKAGPPKFVAWVTQLNLTYSPLTITGKNTGSTIQPDVSTYDGNPAINGTIFVALTDREIPLTPFNLSQINPFVVAGPALYQAG